MQDQDTEQFLKGLEDAERGLTLFPSGKSDAYIDGYYSYNKWLMNLFSMNLANPANSKIKDINDYKEEFLRGMRDFERGLTIRFDDKSDPYIEGYTFRTRWLDSLTDEFRRELKRK